MRRPEKTSQIVSGDIFPERVISGRLTSQHGFFSRRGGVSGGVYKSLNCGLGSDDHLANITENRRRVVQVFGPNLKSLVTPYQVHGAKAVFIRSQDHVQNGRPEADGLVSDDPNLILGVLTADCCPLLFEDQHAGLVGVAHAGWRGAVAGIATEVVRLMLSHGAKSANISVAIGPTIRQSAFEVKDDMRSAALEQDMACSSFFQHGHTSGSYFFDLAGYIADSLLRMGLTRISDTGIDTYSQENYFSYRRATHQRQKEYGRMISAISLS